MGDQFCDLFFLVLFLIVVVVCVSDSSCYHECCELIFVFYFIFIALVLFVLFLISFTTDFG